MTLEPVSVALQFGFLAVLYLFILWVSRSALSAAAPASSASLSPWIHTNARTAGALPATCECAINWAGSRRVSGESESGSYSCAYSSLSRLVRRSALRREFTKTSVERCAMMSA